VIPDFSTCPTVGCGEGTLLENAESTTTHEICESITDPYSVTTYTGWADNQWGEMGDMCNQVTDTLGGGKVQKWYSQVTGACVTLRSVDLTSASSGVITTCSNSSLPVNCYNGVCCPTGYSCGSGGTCVPPTNCPSTYPVSCGTYCCLTGQVCYYNDSCIAYSDMYGKCPYGFDLNCNNGFCCEIGQTCGVNGACYSNKNGSSSCPSSSPVDCNNGFCCSEGSVCNTTNGVTSCSVQSGCNNPDYPVDCNNNYCCPEDFACKTIFTSTACEPINKSSGIKIVFNLLSLVLLVLMYLVL